MQLKKTPTSSLILKDIDKIVDMKRGECEGMMFPGN